MTILRKFNRFFLLSFSLLVIINVYSQPTKIYMVQGSATSALDALTSCNLNGTGLTTLASDAGNFAQPTKLIVDKAAGYIYVADALTSGAGLLRYNLDGTGRTVIIGPVALCIFNGVTIDKAAGKLYYTLGSTTAAFDALMSANLDGSNIQTLASGPANFTQPADVQVDPDGGHLYVSDANVTGLGIIRFNLDGSGRTVIVTPIAAVLYNGLALDLVNDKIYYTQGSATTSLDALKVVNFNGSGMVTLASDVVNFTQPGDVYFDGTNNHLYVSDAASGGNLLRFNIDGTNRQVIVTGTAGALLNGVSLDDPLITLPVHLISFSGRNAEYAHTLEWQVENEEDFSHYELELDKGEGFSSIAHIVATNNRQYKHTHPVHTAGSFLYRLKMVDRDGAFKYSNSIRLDGKAPVTLQLFPNPSKDWVTASIDQPVENIRIFNNTGQLIKVIRGTSNMVVGFSISDLSKGIYIVHVETANQVHKRQLIIQ